MFNGNTLRDAIISGANNIYKYRGYVDGLNVFPVPDGDTGTNMSMSIGNAATALEKIDDNLPAGEVAAVASGAILRGARGNSGVITSLLFRGISKGLKGQSEVTAENLVISLEIGVKSAYKAVMKPTEGTILTVARVASEKAREMYDNDNSVSALEVFAKVIEAAKEALEDTPNLLPVLKKAGVVDAGGAGIVKIFEGMYQVFAGGEIVSADEVASAVTEKKGYEMTFCAEEVSEQELKKACEPLCSCFEATQNENNISVKLESEKPEKVLSKVLDLGFINDIKIQNLNRKKENSGVAVSEDRTTVLKPVEPTNDYGFVAVCAGEGIKSLFGDLGVDTVVNGGQTMNPSTDDILNAIEQTPAKTVFVLPNNKNIIMAAEQAVSLSTRKVIVLPTRTIPMGVSAMLAFDPGVDTQQNAINMKKAYEKVSTGQITFAARDSEYDGFKIKQGELLAIENGKVIATQTDLAQCAVMLCQKMCKKDTGFITLYYGEDVTEDTANEISAQIAAKVDSSIEITVLPGGQPVYYFYIAVE